MAVSSLCMRSEAGFTGKGRGRGGGGGGVLASGVMLKSRHAVKSISWPKMKRRGPGRRWGQSGRRWVGSAVKRGGNLGEQRGRETVMVVDRLEFTTGSWWHHGWILGNIYIGKTICRSLDTHVHPGPAFPSASFFPPSLSPQATNATYGSKICKLASVFFFFQSSVQPQCGVPLCVNISFNQSWFSLKWKNKALPSFRLNFATPNWQPLPRVSPISFSSRSLPLFFCLQAWPPSSIGTVCSLCACLAAWEKKRHKGALGPEICLWLYMRGCNYICVSSFFLCLKKINSREGRRVRCSLCLWHVYLF